VYLAETDTCPQNRYSTSAALLHSHFTASILEGATGAKHWITRLAAFEPNSGKAYRKKLSKYAKFYEALTEYYKQLSPFGCRIPLTHMQVYGFVPEDLGLKLSPWATSFLERLGLPLYFSNEGEGAVFIDDFSVNGFDNEEIKQFMSGTAIFSVGAAEKLCERGFTEELGVKVGSESDVIDRVGVTLNSNKIKVASGERIGKVCLSTQYGKRELIPLSDETEWLSQVYCKDPQAEEITPLYPGVTRKKNSYGGECIVFSGTPDMPFKYFTAFSLLNETRKKQMIDILSKNGNLPIYYPEDAEVYLRAGRLTTGEIFAAVFNLSQDALDELPLVVDGNVSSVERLNENGKLVRCEFESFNNMIYVKESVAAMEPIVLIIK